MIAGFQRRAGQQHPFAAIVGRDRAHHRTVAGYRHLAARSRAAGDDHAALGIDSYDIEGRLCGRARRRRSGGGSGRRGSRRSGCGRRCRWRRGFRSAGCGCRSGLRAWRRGRCGWRCRRLGGCCSRLSRCSCRCSSRRFRRRRGIAPRGHGRRIRWRGTDFRGFRPLRSEAQHKRQDDDRDNDDSDPDVSLQRALASAIFRINYGNTMGDWTQ